MPETPNRFQQQIARIDAALEAAREALPDTRMTDVALAQALATLAVAEANRAIYDAVSDIHAEIQSGRLDAPIR